MISLITPPESKQLTPTTRTPIQRPPSTQVTKFRENLAQRATKFRDATSRAIDPLILQYKRTTQKQLQTLDQLKKKVSSLRFDTTKVDELRQVQKQLLPFFETFSKELCRLESLQKESQEEIDHNGDAITVVDTTALRELNEKIASLTAIRNRVESTLSTLNQEVSRIEKKQTELQRSASQIWENIRQSDERIQKLSSLQPEVSSLQAEVGSLQSETRSLQTQAEVLRSSSTSLSHSTHVLENNCKEMQTTLSQMQAALEEIERQMDEEESSNGILGIAMVVACAAAVILTAGSAAPAVAVAAGDSAGFTLGTLFGAEVKVNFLLAAGAGGSAALFSSSGKSSDSSATTPSSDRPTGLQKVCQAHPLINKVCEFVLPGPQTAKSSKHPYHFSFQTASDLHHNCPDMDFALLPTPTGVRELFSQTKKTVQIVSNKFDNARTVDKVTREAMKFLQTAHQVDIDELLPTHLYFVPGSGFVQRVQDSHFRPLVAKPLYEKITSMHTPDGSVPIIIKSLPISQLNSELIANKFYPTLNIPNVRVPKILAVGKQIDFDGHRNAMFAMSRASGHELENLMGHIASGNVPDHRPTLLKGMEHVGGFLAALHNKSLSFNSSPSPQYIADEINRFYSLYQQVRQNSEFNIKAKPEEIESLIRAFAQNPGKGCFTHGDPHAANFLLDSNVLEIIDLNFLTESLGKNGVPVGVCVRDYEEMMHLTYTAARLHGLNAKTTAELQKAFRARYINDFKGLHTPEAQNFYRVFWSFGALLRSNNLSQEFVDQFNAEWDEIQNPSPIDLNQRREKHLKRLNIQAPLFYPDPTFPEFDPQLKETATNLSKKIGHVIAKKWEKFVDEAGSPPDFPFLKNPFKKSPLGKLGEKILKFLTGAAHSKEENEQNSWRAAFEESASSMVVAGAVSLVFKSLPAGLAVPAAHAIAELAEKAEARLQTYLDAHPQEKPFFPAIDPRIEHLTLHDAATGTKVLMQGAQIPSKALRKAQEKLIEFMDVAFDELGITDESVLRALLWLKDHPPSDEAFLP